jgi:cell division septum initiation protein DivIVA
MTDRILSDARNLKKLIREAEALADESMIAFSRLKQAMLAARQNPAVEVYEGQRAIIRLNQAENQAIAMSTNLLRVHDELSKIAREKMGDDKEPTNIPAATIQCDEATDQNLSLVS